MVQGKWIRPPSKKGRFGASVVFYPLAFSNLFRIASNRSSPTPRTFWKGSSMAVSYTHLLSADPDAEQAGCLSGSGRSVRVEMMGGEFCGNASRSAAAYWAHIHGEEGVFEVTCSGAKAPMEARVKKLGSTPPHL